MGAIFLAASNPTDLSTHNKPAWRIQVGVK